MRHLPIVLLLTPLSVALARSPAPSRAPCSNP
jgi:hypothetical protein